MALYLEVFETLIDKSKQWKYSS